MFWRKTVREHPEFKIGMADFGPQALGIVAWGLMIGVAMVNSGMGTLPAVAMALLVFAGSSQLAAIPLIVAGAPAWVIFASCIPASTRLLCTSRTEQPSSLAASSG